jgi:hypothetical protein
MDAGSQLGAGPQARTMNEINAPVWPSPSGVGVLDPITQESDGPGGRGVGIVKTDPSTEAYDTSIVTEALTGIEGDTKAESFTKGPRPAREPRPLAATREPRPLAATRA